MAARKTAETSADCRLKGNECYKAGNFTKAISLYMNALKLDENDPTPIANISTVKYETGEYEGCMASIADALKKEKTPAKVLQLQLRRLRCYFHLGRLGYAIKAADELLATESAAQAKAEIESIKTASEKGLKLVKTGSDRWPPDLPIYRPSIWKECPEYFPRGHDDAEPLISMSQLQLYKLRAPLDVCFFYGGIGDARHFYQQMHHILSYERARRRANGGANAEPSSYKYFFTLVDHSPHALARTLIIFRLIYDVGTLPQRIENVKERTREKYKTLCTLWYVFAGDIMPRFAYDRLRATMTKLKDATDSGIPWLRTDSDTYDAVKKVYETWLGPAKDRYDVKYAQFMLTSPIAQDDKLYLEKMWPGVEVEWELKQYKKTCVMIPPKDIMRMEEPDLKAILAEKIDNNDKIPKIRDLARRTWKTNVTLVDPQAENSPWRSTWTDTCHILQNVTNMQACVSEEALRDTMSYLKKRKLKALGSVEVMAVYFKSIAEFMARNMDNITVEYRYTEVNSFMDSIRYGLRPVGYPRRYDAIHMSNIPDYTGGHLTTTIHGTGILKNGGFVQFNCLANTGIWENVDNAMAEYLGLPSLSCAERYIGMTLAPGEEYDPTAGWVSMLADYRWVYTPPNRDSLIPKLEVHTWLTYMFFHLALPTKRSPDMPAWIGGAICRVYQPLTINTWIRLLCYVVESRHYPKHWISALVEAILSGTVNTSARPARACPLKVRELQTPHPAKPISTQPFVPELRTLLARQLQHLPFKLATPLPSPADILRCEIAITPLTDVVAPVLSLVFSRQIQIPDLIPSLNPLDDRNLWDTLAGDDEPVRKKETIVIGNFEWDGEWVLNTPFTPIEEMKRVKARFCVERRVLDMMRREGWRCALIRTDLWCLASMDPETVAEATTVLGTLGS